MENNKIKELQKDFHYCADNAIKAISNEIFGDDSKQLRYFLLSAYDTGKGLLTGAGGNMDPGNSFAFFVNLVAQVAKNKGLSEETFCYAMGKAYKNLNGGSNE